MTQPAQPANPRAIVAQVGPYSITEATLERFTRARLNGEPASERLVPPKFSACVAHLQAESASRDEPEPGSAQLRGECQTRYEKLREAALEGLITDDWLIGAAHELRAPVGGHDANESLQRKAKLANEAIKRAVAERVKPVTQTQIASYYRQHRFQYLITGERDVRIARAETPTSAADVRTELASGESFATVVRQLHVRQADYSKEGLVLELKPHEYGEPKLNKAIFAAKPRVLSRVVGTSFGYFVFEVTRVRFEDERSLKELEASIHRQLSASPQERALEAFFKQSRATWKARMVCQAGYVVPDCR